MRNIFKSWKTTLIGVIALLGLCWNIYNNGGIEVTDFLLLVVGVGFIATKDVGSTHSKGSSIGGDLPPPEEEEEPV